MVGLYVLWWWYFMWTSRKRLGAFLHLLRGKLDGWKQCKSGVGAIWYPFLYFIIVIIPPFFHIPQQCMYNWPP